MRVPSLEPWQRWLLGCCVRAVTTRETSRVSQAALQLLDQILGQVIRHFCQHLGGSRVVSQQAVRDPLYPPVVNVGRMVSLRLRPLAIAPHPLGR